MFFKQGLGRCKLGPKSMSAVIARKQVQKQIQLTALTASLRTILVIPRPTGTIIDTPKVTTRSQPTNKISNQPNIGPTIQIFNHPTRSHWLFGLQKMAQKISTLMLKLGDWATGTKLPIKEIDHQGQNASKY